MRNMGRGLLTVVVTFCLAVGAAECASIKVKHTYEPTADFSEYKTFSIVPSQSIDDANVRGALEVMIASELERKGLAQVEDEGDLIVTYDAAIGNKEQIAANLGYAVETYNGMTTVYTVGRGVPVGAMIIALIERSSGQLVWKAVGTGAVKENAAPEQRVKRLEGAVKKILASYPPKR